MSAAKRVWPNAKAQAEANAAAARELEYTRAILRVHPELVFALVTIVREIGPQFGVNDDDAGTLHTVSRVARAAIAKAAEVA